MENIDTGTFLFYGVMSSVIEPCYLPLPGLVESLVYFFVLVLEHVLHEFLPLFLSSAPCGHSEDLFVMMR